MDKEIETRISYTSCGLEESLIYEWPDRFVERFEKALCYNVNVSGRIYPLYVAYGYLFAFEKNRRRVIVLLKRGEEKVDCIRS